MSLINDALKKAARQRAEDQAEVAPPAQMGARKRIARRGAPMTVQTLVLLVGGAAVLIAASVVVTVVLIIGKPEPKAAVARPSPVTPEPQAAPSVTVQLPIVTAVSVPRPTAPPPTAAPVAIVFPSPTPTAVAPAVAVQAAPAQAAKPALVAPPLSRGDQVQAFVDGLRVTGVRAAGADSKALVDGHVYRVNDILDRALGIRLVQVDADHLTLVDASGVTYIKSF